MSKANNISFGIILFLAIIFLENVTACDFYCSTCEDCNSKINLAGSGQTICLNASILVDQQICIYNPENFSNKTFDCRGYEIRSSSLAIAPGSYPSGIYLYNKLNNTIKNCILTSFINGIYLRSSSNNTIINNTITKNTSLSFGSFNGIYLTSSSNNTIMNNHIISIEYGIYTYDNSNFNMIKNNILNNNKVGITSSNCFPDGDDIYSCLSSGNLNNTIKNNEILNNAVGIYSQNSTSIINGNIVCGNTNLDFNSSDWLSSYGDNNNCSNPGRWNDNNKTGCSYCCDGSVPKIYYLDFDSDGYGNLTDNITTCNATIPTGYVNNSMDCNNNNSLVNPNASEICNNIDDNCNEQIDEDNVCSELCYIHDGNGSCTINSGENCSCINEALNDNINCYAEVKLNSSIWNWTGTCINNPANFSNKIFDCRGNTIKGNKTKDSYGILLSKKSNDTIRNCIINGFDYGIYIYASSENKILNNTLNSNNHGIYVSSPNSLSCSGYGYVCIHSSYGDYAYSEVEKRFVLISGDEQSLNNEISNNSACENEISDISLNNEGENFGDNICDKISNNTNTMVFCSKNCSSSELQKTLFLYYCDYDVDSYFSKYILGYCFGNESCIPAYCSLNKGNDCNDDNVSINPNTQEIECNGIDENCDGFDKCGKRIWSSDKHNKEKNTFYSYQGVYVAGTGFNASSKIEVYIIPHGISINLSDFKIKKNITTDENGNFGTLLWNLPAWNELSILYYDIIADENLNGIYENNEAIDASPFGFSVDPIWASDENGNSKETFCENETIYVYGKGLPVINKNITLYFVPDVKIPVGSKFCYRECINISHPVRAEIDENGNFRDVVLGWSNAKPGEYDIIPDLNNNGIFDEIDKKATDDSYFIGFTVEKKFDFDNNNAIDIFDAVSALENLSDRKIIYNTECSDVNNNGIDLIDIFYLMERIVN